MRDLTGEIFGELKVIKYIKKNKHGKAIWLCICSCGKEKEIVANNLLSGKTRSCGHIRKNKSNSDIGKVFGNAKVLSISDKPIRSNGVIVYCECLLCGNKYEANLRNLKKGFCQSCGCDKLNSLVGKRYGRLQVIKFSKKDIHGHSVWLCKCDCGNEVFATTSNLNTGRMISCGCRKRDSANNMVNKIYGFSKVLRILDEVSSDGATIAECQCLKCGNIFQIQTNSLKKGYESSCGCYKSTQESKNKKGLYNNTHLPNLLSPKLYKTNTTGVRGVQKRNGKYRAMVRFQKKTYYLGTYETLEEAAKARKTAEEKLVLPLIREYINSDENKGSWIEKYICDIDNKLLELDK